MADRRVLAQLLFFQKQVAVLGEQEKGDPGSLAQFPLELAAGLALNKVGRRRTASSGEGSGLRDGRTSWGGAGPGQRPLLHSETRKLVTIMEQFINRVPLPAPGPSPTGDDPTNWF